MPTLRILHLEDDPADAELIEATLRDDGVPCETVRVESKTQFLAALDGPYDLILSDYALPGFDGGTAQILARERRPDLPFVFVSGTIGEEVAIERLKEGATDYVLKQRLARLPSAVRRALEESRERRERRSAEREVRRLAGELEQRVVERTAQLAAANAALSAREAELAEAKSFLEQLIAASPSMILRFEPHDLRVTYVSPNIGWLLGYSLPEVIGVAGFWEEIIHPDDRAHVVDRLRDAIDNTVVQIEQEYRCRGKDGRYRWLFTLLRIDYDDAASPVGVLGYALDIADRKAAEEEVRRTNAFLDSIVENLPHMIFVKDARDLRFVRLNRAGEVLLGRHRGEVVGRSDHDLLPARVADEFARADRAVLSAGCAIDIPEEVLPRPSDEPRIMHTKKIPIFDASGQPQYLLGISEDVTERRKAEEEVRLARLEAERANRAKSEFLSRMSHDLRTPLNAILGFAQLLEMDVKTPEEQDNVRQILNGGTHLLDLINEILDIASIEAGRLPLSPETLAVSEAIVQVSDLLRPLADMRGIQLSVDLGSCDGLYVRGDRQRLRQVLVNLIGNAVKYNRPSGSVLVSCRPEGATTAIRITDTGPGIAPDRMARLFQPFDRLGAEFGPEEGTGLGLAVSKGLVEAMGGALSVESRAGIGSTFSFQLPRATAAAVTADVPAALPSPEPRSAGGTVLYIEDNASNLRLLRRLIGRRPQLQLITASSGSEGLSSARRDAPDLILLDLHLPDMTGEEVLGKLKADPSTSNIPVVILSADAIPAQVTRLTGSGATAYLSKPIDVTRLFRLLDEWLGRRPGEERDA